MATNGDGGRGKKRQKLDESSDESSSEESENEEMASDESIDENLEIPVEFEAFPPAECDFKSMKMLLQQLFLKSSVNLSELADLIIAQDKIGSIIKVVDDDEEEEEKSKEKEKSEQNGGAGPSSEEEEYEEEILGLITILDFVKYKEKNCIQQIKELLLKKCKEYAEDKTHSGLKEILDGGKRVGLLISERFINIPPHVALPLYKSLQTELQHHFKKEKGTKLDYVIIISKSFREKDSSNKPLKSSSKKGKKLAKKEAKEEQELDFSNVEDEILFKESTLKFSYPASVDNNDTLIGGKWSFDDAVLLPYRTVMVIPYKQLNNIVDQMETFLAT